MDVEIAKMRRTTSAKAKSGNPKLANGGLVTYTRPCNYDAEGCLAYVFE